MVKSVLGVNHQGLREWVIQRVSAIVMAIYSVGLIAYLLMHSPLAFYEWHNLFSHLWMKTATLLFVAAVLYHAWIGMWTIFTDYVKVSWLCIFLNIVVLLILVSFFFATLLILWGV